MITIAPPSPSATQSPGTQLIELSEVAGVVRRDQCPFASTYTYPAVSVAKHDEVARHVNDVSCPVGATTKAGVAQFDSASVSSTPSLPSDTHVSPLEQDT